MAGLNYTYRPIYWRLRAEELRSIADAMSVADCKERLHHLANEYDAVADSLERSLRDLLHTPSEHSNVQHLRGS